MNKQFTASEVRAEIDQAFRYHVNDMLRAFADMLEAQEKSVPVVTRESAINAIEHVGRYNGPDRETEARQMLVEGSPSTAHPAQAQPPAASVTDVDVLAQEIRRVDGDHKMGAARLAEHIVQFLATQENPNG